MAAGRWAMTAETVKFAKDGTLLDGQHRLMALIQAGVDVEMVVARGLDPAVQDMMDTGAARTPGDFLRLGGYANSNALGCAARWGVLFDRDALYLGTVATQVTHAEIGSFVEAGDPLLADSVRWASNHRGLDVSVSLTGLCAFLCARVDGPAAEDFFGRAHDGVDLGVGSPILALRNRLRRAQAERLAITTPDYLSITIRAWNAWRKGETLTTLPIRRGASPIRCPKPL
jgi:hypothetical protein